MLSVLVAATSSVLISDIFVSTVPTKNYSLYKSKVVPLHTTKARVEVRYSSKISLFRKELYENSELYGELF